MTSTFVCDNPPRERERLAGSSLTPAPLSRISVPMITVAHTTPNRRRRAVLARVR